MLTKMSRKLLRLKGLGLAPTSTISSLPSAAAINKNFYRQASQLYPTTSQKWDEAMTNAEYLLTNDTNSFSSLQKLISGEFVSITRYLEKLVGTNHPMLETAKRCAYISEGRMGSAQARGLTVLLTAKAAEKLVVPSKERSLQQIAVDQISLAEMTEITYSAYMIHRGVMDLASYEYEQALINNSLAGDDDKDIRIIEDVDESTVQHIAGSTAVIKGVHYGNKVSALCGDFLLAHVMRGLGELFSSKAVDLIASSITEFIKGEFLLLDDWRSENFILSEKSRDLNRWIQRSCSSIGTLQGNTCQAAIVLANGDECLQERAFEFGKNLGLAWQAHTELQPFLSQIYEPIELAEMPPYPSFDLNSLPVLFFLRHSYNNFSNFNSMIEQVLKRKNRKIGEPIQNINGWELNYGQHRHQDTIDYAKLHYKVLAQGSGLELTQKLIEEFTTKAMEQLKFFPENQAHDALYNICLSLQNK